MTIIVKHAISNHKHTMFKTAGPLLNSAEHIQKDSYIIVIIIIIIIWNEGPLLDSSVIMHGFQPDMHITIVEANVHSKK